VNLPADLECDIETWEDEVDEYLARAVFEHMQLNEDEVYYSKHYTFPSFLLIRYWHQATSSY